MGRSYTKCKKLDDRLMRYYHRYGYPKDRNNQALPQILHIWTRTTAINRIGFRKMRRKYLSYP